MIRYLLPFLFAPSLALAESHPKFDLTLRSYRECAPVFGVRFQDRALTPNHAPFRNFDERFCSSEERIRLGDNTPSLETTAWLRLGNGTSMLHTIGVGFRFKIDDGGVTHLKVRKRGLFLSYNITF